MLKSFKLFGFLFSFLFASHLFAQSDLSLYSMRSLPQISRVNPAITPYSSVNVSLPFMNYMAKANSNRFAMGNFADLDPGASAEIWQEGARKVFRGIYDDLDEENNVFSTQAEINLLSFGFKVGWNYFYFHASERVSLDFRYPRAVLDLFNPDIDLHGRDIPMSGTDFTALHFREYALTYARKLTPALSVGATAKYLYGMDAIRGDDLKLNFQSDINQPYLNFVGSGQVYTSLGAKMFTQDELSYSDLYDYAYRYNNHGFAIDFGASLQVLDRLKISASLIDLGSIKWKENLTS